LKKALEDLALIRKAGKTQVKDICYMVRAARGNAQHYLIEIQDSRKG
jgi:hypothetical protein